MPTVIALDVSLSMCRPILIKTSDAGQSDSAEDLPSRRTLAVEIIKQFLEHVNSHCKLEFLTLLTFSTYYEVVTSFERDMETMLLHLKNVSVYDRTNYESLITGINTVVLDTWGTTVPIQVLLITDGCGGIGPGCLKEVVQTCKPFPFPTKLNVICLSDPNEKTYTENCQLLQRLIDVTCGDGIVYLPENHLTPKGCASAVSRLCAKDFTPYKGTLKCGNLHSKITLCPSPQPFISRADDKRYDFSDEIEIVGFIEGKDICSPPAHSRHLLLPLRSDSTYALSKAEDPEEDTDSKVSNFCVLLHGALKVDNKCALCEVGYDWYGLIYTWADNKKKSNLMLSILPPGTDAVPWIGSIQFLGPENDYIAKTSMIPSFPVKVLEKKSYGGTPTVWTTSSGLNSDIQKLLRHARKLPEKNNQFYKELNRMRKWALTIGFTEVLESVAQILERECMVSANSTEASIQLTHAASQLRSLTGYSKVIQPLVQ